MAQQLLDEQDAFSDCLSRIGLNAPTVDFISSLGLQRVQDLMELPLAQMNELITQVSRAVRPISTTGRQQAGQYINMSLIHSRRIKALRLWCNYRQAAEQDVLPTFFTDDVLPVWVAQLERLECALATTADSTKPPQLASLMKWTVWERKFSEYLLNQRSLATGAPLTYITRTHEEVTQAMRDKNYDNLDLQMIATMAFHGLIFRVDNERMYGILKEFIGDGPGWAFIQPYDATRNGLLAWKALLAQTVGQSAVDMRVSKAYNDIATAKYTGTAKSFSLDQYIGRHQMAHNELLALNHPVPERKKVMDFMTGISDPKLDNAKGAILGDPVKMNDFSECQHYILTYAANFGINTNIESA